MAANNYFGFTHGGTQYATATGYQPAPQAGYAVPPAYTSPRAAAIAYDVASYQTAAATQSAYVIVVPGYEAGYSNINIPTLSKNQIIEVRKRPNNAQKRQNWFKINISGFAGAAKSNNSIDFASLYQEIYYCEVCCISYDGTQTYKKHLKRQKHKKREANLKLSTTNVIKPSTIPLVSFSKVFHSDLCDISCTDADSYAAHLKGSKHKKAVTTYTVGVVPKKQCQANSAAYATSSAMQQKVTYPIQSAAVASSQTTNKVTAVPGYEAVYLNTNFPTQSQYQIRPNNAQKTQNSFKKSTTGFAGVAKGNNRIGFASRSQEIHYCEVCGISCAGTQTYKEHLKWQIHKKCEANSKLSTTNVIKPSTNPATKVFHCDLCDISCTGADSYAAHLRGSKHQKVYNLHTRLGTVVPKVESNVSPVVTVKTESKVLPPVVTPIATEETDDLLIGMEFIEEIKDETGKMVSFNCKLCECKFNDPNVKEMHMKGRRHRLPYKKKVDPSLIVELMKLSWFETRRIPQGNQHDDSIMREDRSNFWADRFMDMEDKYSLEQDVVLI